jgi:hypothetical protein
MRAECVPHQDICGVYAVLTEATSSVWDPDELIYSIKAEFPVLCRAFDETRESKRKEVLEALHQGLPTCSEADVMRLLQAHDRAMQRRPMCTPTATAETTAAPKAPAGLACSAMASSASLPLCTTCLGRYMSARDLAALLLLGGMIPGLRLTAPPIWSTRADEAHKAMPLTLGARGEMEARRDGGEIEGPEAAYKAAETLFLELDPMRTGSIMLRQLLVAFNPPSAELRRAIVKAGLGYRLGSALSASEQREQDQLNKALALSLSEQEEPNDDDVLLNKALALSLSEREEPNDDDVLLKRAIEASKLHAQARADKAAAMAREEEEFKRALEASREAFAWVAVREQSGASPDDARLELEFLRALDVDELGVRGLIERIRDR